MIEKWDEDTIKLQAVDGSTFCLKVTDFTVAGYPDIWMSGHFWLVKYVSGY